MTAGKTPKHIKLDERNHVDEVVKQLTSSFPGTGLLQNNKYLFEMLLESTSVSENRRTGE
jgi:type I restriction enzyme, R subunit